MEPFGKRYNFDKSVKQIQIDSLDEDLRIALYNGHYRFFLEDLNSGATYQHHENDNLLKEIWTFILNKRIDEYNKVRYAQEVRHLINHVEWYKVYEFFENLFDYVPPALKDIEGFKEYIETELIIHNSGYRIIKGRFVPVTNAEEKNEIETLQKTLEANYLNEIGEHLEKAMKYLTGKPQPDLRNSIKESISMVEVIARRITGESTLGKALKAFEKKKNIHPLLSESFIKYYAFTNGESGIRHALMEDQSLDLATARYFLITCSAFTNYLVQKAIDEGIIEAA